METIDDIVKEQNAAAAESIKGKEETPKVDGEEIKDETQVSETNVQAEKKAPDTDKPEEEKTLETPKGEEIKETFIDTINKKYGSSFKSDDEIGEIIKGAANYNELAAKIKEYEESIEKVREAYKPENIYGSLDRYKQVEIAKKLESEGKDPGMVADVLTTDLKELNDLEAATMDYMLNNSSLKTIDAAVIVLDKIGVEFDGDPTEKEITEAYNELTIVQKARLKDLSFTSRKNLQAVKDTEVPEVKDYFEEMEAKNKKEKEELQERQDNLKKQWDPHIDEIRKGVEIIKVTAQLDDDKTDEYDFSVGKEDVANLKKVIHDWVLEKNLEATPDNIKLAVEEFKKSYLMLNWHKLYNARVRELVSQQTEKLIKETENPTEFSKKVNTGGKKTDEEIAASQLKDFGLT